MVFEPIAIVGRSCLLPGANTPEQLWQNVLAGKDCLTHVSENYWQVKLSEVVKHHADALEDVTDTCLGGYVNHFSNVFKPELFGDKAELILRQDIICQWLLHTGNEALQQANYDFLHPCRKKVGAIIGNLSYPTLGLSEYAQAVWLTRQRHPLLDQTSYEKLLAKTVLPHHRFMSGYPVHFMADVLGLTATAYALDAACASSLYAIKLACDELQQGRADLMLAGGINQADDLFLHIGFSVLNAISKTGKSQPLHQQADGLIPAQGVALVALKRLTDAMKDKDKIYGVIRGIGLANDGATSGFLLPAKEGQLRAMRAAYQNSGVEPKEIAWLECHATGTPVGDRIEIESMLEWFANHQQLGLGALKANIGHTITASGAAALINVLSAFEQNIKPPGRLPQEQAIDLLQTDQFKLSVEPQAWCSKNSPRYAAINNFGFGGNNAHLIIQDFTLPKSFRSKKPTKCVRSHHADIAIVAVGIKHAQTDDKKFSHIELPIKEIRFPPVDLQHTLGQQLAILALLRETLVDLSTIPPEKTAVFIGMQCDAEIARYSLKWRLGKLFPAAEKIWLKQARANIMPALTPAHVIGCMPNIVTNRLNKQFGFQGASFSISAEQLSGIRGLQIAMHALQQHEIDHAIVGAVDLACEPVNQQATQTIFADKNFTLSDTAVIVVMKRLPDAIQNGDNIYGLLHQTSPHDIDQEIDCNENQINQLMGYSHTTSGLLNVADLAIKMPEQFNLMPAKTSVLSKITCTALGGVTSSIILEKKSHYL